MLEPIAHGPVLELRLNRPPANALSPALMTRLRDELRSAPAAGAGALVLSGAPGMFSAGLDVPQLLTLDRDGIASAWQEFFGLLGTLARSPLPIVAAITGHSPAGGAVMALFCDGRVMAEGSFRIGFNEVEVGIPIPTLIYQAVAQVVGKRQAERLAVGGLMIELLEALTIGLVDELAPVEEVVARAVRWCRRLLSLPRGPMLKSRRVARAELCSLFGEEAGEVDSLADEWFKEETQTALRAMVERIGKST
jgi:enoyl-CoA hydratase/carnithine racemase